MTSASSQLDPRHRNIHDKNSHENQRPKPPIPTGPSFQTATTVPIGPPESPPLTETEFGQSDLLAFTVDDTTEAEDAPTPEAAFSILPGIGIHHDFGDLVEREAKYNKLNDTSLGHTGTLEPKYIVDLINYKEGTLCPHNKFWIKINLQVDKKQVLCMKCKHFQKYTVRQCFLCKTKCCHRCWLEVVDDMKKRGAAGGDRGRGRARRF
ncbi:hypothetical protein TWF694_000928 [Orbilia ellipsospora]|uniref:Uncharacterized protein n=1 Tax=Orbilia ellipsospora TaxID=2528407 RepID=A0AAV9XQ20_9PEZI